MKTSEMQGVQGRVRMDIIDATKFASKESIEEWVRSWKTQDKPDPKYLLYSQKSPNKIVAVGRAYLGLMVKGATSSPTDVAVGTGGTAPADGDTALGTEVFKDDITQRLDITDGLRIRFLLSASSANGNTLTEAAVLGPTPNFYMLSRVTYTGIVKTSSVAVNYTWDITFTEP